MFSSVSLTSAESQVDCRSFLLGLAELGVDEAQVVPFRLPMHGGFHLRPTSRGQLPARRDLHQHQAGRVVLLFQAPDAQQVVLAMLAVGW